jgi:transcription elongation GreA/GreB family factor
MGCPFVLEQGETMTSSSEPPVLTGEGRARLEERVRRLEEETIPAVLSAMDEDSDELGLQLEHDMASNELERLRYVLQTARSLDEIPEDPDVVQIGDWVSLRTDDGEVTRHLIVHPAEAGIDMNRISAESPLAQAVLGRRVGEVAVVQAPSGAYSARIVETLREH